MSIFKFEFYYNDFLLCPFNQVLIIISFDKSFLQLSKDENVPLRNRNI